MSEIGIWELKSKASEVIIEVAEGASFVVTKRGKAAAVIMPLEEAEDLVLAHAEGLLRERRKARTDYRAGRAVRLKDID